MQWLTIAPILAYGTEKLKLPFDFGNGVTLQQIPEWMRADEYTSQLSYFQRTGINKFPSAFVVSYEADALSDQQPEAAKRVGIANLALWLAQPSGVGCHVFMHFLNIKGKWSLTESSASRQIVPLPAYEEERLTNKVKAEAASFCVAMTKHKESVQTASYYLSGALIERNYNTRYILLWTGLEALFGPDSPAEVSYRLSQRLALFITDSRIKARKLFKDIKSGYDLRSLFVHGKEPGKKRATDEILLKSEMWLREAMIRILGDPTLLGIFGSKSRDEYLNDLVFY